MMGREGRCRGLVRRLDDGHAFEWGFLGCRLVYQSDDDFHHRRGIGNEILNIEAWRVKKPAVATSDCKIYKS